jgi:glycosyltransferase involved in cell wall biosynthesis
MIKVSIIIPTYNRAERLKKAIESALEQDYENLEVLVSDNNSTDNTQDIVEEFFSDNRFIYNKNDTNIGMIFNWRKGLELSSGDYFLLLSDDDYLINNQFISQAVEIIEKYENILMVGSDGIFSNESKNKKVEYLSPLEEFNNGKKIFMNYFNTEAIQPMICGCVYNKDFAIKVNSFSNKYNLHCDSEIFLKACICGNIGIVKKLSYIYTIGLDHENLSNNMDKNYENIVNNIEHFTEPYNIAVKYNKLNDSEKKEWEDTVLFIALRNALIRVLFYSPEKYSDTIEIFHSKNPKVFNMVLNSRYLKVILFLKKIHLFEIFYKIAYYFFMRTQSV